MAADWRVLHYETAEGTCPIREFVDSRKIREQAKTLALISYLQDHGPPSLGLMQIYGKTGFMSSELSYPVINSGCFISSAIGNLSC